MFSLILFKRYGRYESVGREYQSTSANSHSVHVQKRRHTGEFAQRRWRSRGLRRVRDVMVKSIVSRGSFAFASQ